QVPDALMQMFGKPSFVMVIKMDGRTLADVSIEKVRESLKSDGFFLKVPPPPVNELERHKDLKAQLKVQD
ncbi:YcgL domain-containing protein, partial [Vibrio echinoideorum]